MPPAHAGAEQVPGPSTRQRNKVADISMGQEHAGTRFAARMPDLCGFIVAINVLRALIWKRLHSAPESQ